MTEERFKPIAPKDMTPDQVAMVDAMAAGPTGRKPTRGRSRRCCEARTLETGCNIWAATSGSRAASRRR